MGTSVRADFRRSQTSLGYTTSSLRPAQLSIMVLWRGPWERSVVMLETIEEGHSPTLWEEAMGIA